MKLRQHKRNILVAALLLTGLIVTGCSEASTPVPSQDIHNEVAQETPSSTTQQPEEDAPDQSEDKIQENENSTTETVVEENISESGSQKDGYYEYKGKSYKIITVDGGDRSGTREKNVAVDIGFGDRLYWGLTNEYGQLVYVIADKITLQDDNTEPVNSQGRYYDDEANVPGTERKDLDQGHVIADSLGGVSNAYNITPQNSTLNRHGDQAYMEKVIRQAGGCTNFVATITYPDTSTQIPSSYRYEYTVKGNKTVDEFPNANPEGTANKEQVATSKPAAETNKPSNGESTAFDEQAELARIDTNGNGKVTIKEAKAAGYSMPIYSTHWLYKYMDDRDGDGMVGE